MRKMGAVGVVEVVAVQATDHQEDDLTTGRMAALILQKTKRTLHSRGKTST